MKNKQLYNLTNPQMNIYLREQYYHNSSINIIAGYLTIQKNIKTEVLNQMLNMLIEESDSMRLRIVKNVDDNKPYQYVKEHKNQLIPVIDVSNKTKKEVLLMIENDLEDPLGFFDTELYQFKIYKLKNRESIITMKIHHIIADAWTFKLIADRTLENYSRIVKDKEELKKFSYLDYVKKEQKYLESDIFKRDQKYWNKYLENIYEPAVLKDISLSQEINSARIEKKLSKKTHLGVMEFCRQNKITPYTFFLSVLSIYLYKTTNKEEFTIGTPLLNRRNFQEKNTTGMYISTIPLKVKINHATKVKDLCLKFASDIRKALRHQRYPYLNMLEYVREIKSDFNNLFEVMLSFQNIKVGGTDDLKKATHTWLYNKNQQTQFEFHISQYSEKKPFVLGFDFKDDVASEEERKLIISRFFYLIENIINSDQEGNVTVDNIKYIPLLEIKKIEVMSNNKSKNIFVTKKTQTIRERFEKQAKKSPNKIAVKYKQEYLTYKNLNVRANIVATKLQEQGVVQGDAIAIILDKSLEMAISILGVIKLGAYFIPIATDWPLERVKYIVKNSKAKCLITSKKFLKIDYGVENLDIKKLLNVKDKKLDKTKNQQADIKLNDILYVLYTSGSTGNPKGVLITHKNVSTFLDGMKQMYNIETKDVWSMFHSYTFDVSMWEFFGPLLTGGTLVIVPDNIRKDSKKMLHFLRDEQISILSQTPSYFYKLVLQDEKENLIEDDLSLKYIVLGGEPVYATPIKPWLNKYNKIKIMNGYGPTEATIYIATGEITKEDVNNDNIHIGKPVIGDIIEIRDKREEILPIGCTGELYMSGAGIGLGYLNDEERTKAVFRKENGEIIYKSGDIGYYNPDGRITCLGRTDNQIKIRGFRVEIQEVESALLDCKEVTRAAVIVVDGKNYTKKLVAFIETKKKNYIEEVLTTISQTLTPYMIPQLYQLEEFPLTTSGKIDRRGLLTKLEKLKEEENNKKIIEPENETEAHVLKVIKRITRKRKVSTKDDFFRDLNMDSLDIMTFATSLSEYNITVQDINDKTTVQTLAEVIKERKENISFNNIKKEELEDVKVVNKTHVFNLSNVLLTGVTGFLGSHLLLELLKQEEVENVFCLIRKKPKQTIKKRFESVVERYLSDLNKKYLEKVILIEGDFEEKKLSLSDKDSNKIKEKVTTIIHAGANVKHFGEHRVSHKTNVYGTKQIINFAQKISAAVAHISTLSVAGISHFQYLRELNENKLYIGQMFFKNVYLTTKYQAETEILKAINNNKIKAKIFRMGNIMPREKDGVFQTNITENAFLNKIRTCLKTGMVVESIANYPIDLTPVDSAAKAIVMLLKDKNEQTVYNISSDKHIKFGEILHLAETPINITDTKTQIKEIQKLKDPRNALLLANLQAVNFVENPNSNIITTRILTEKGFVWQMPSQQYIKSLLKIANF